MPSREYTIMVMPHLRLIRTDHSMLCHIIFEILYVDMG